MSDKQKGKIVKGGDNSTPTTLPQYDGFDPIEWNSIRKDAIDKLYDPITPREQKESFKLGIREIEKKILRGSFNQWVSTGKMPEELGTTIRFSYEEKRLANKPQCDFKVEEFQDLGIKIGALDVTFIKFSANRTYPINITALGWTPTMLGVLKDISILGSYSVKPNQNKQSVSNDVSELNKQICYMTGLEHDKDNLPIYYDRAKKRRYSRVAITMYDSDEKYLDAQVRSDKSIGVTFKPIHKDTRDDEAMQDHLRKKHSDKKEDEHIYSWDRDRQNEDDIY